MGQQVEAPNVLYCCVGLSGRCVALSMIRTQVLLTEDDLAAVRSEARRLGISMSEVIRRQLKPLKSDSSLPASEDPFLALIGAFSDPDGPTDVSVNHDHYLYGWPKKH